MSSVFNQDEMHADIVFPTVDMEGLIAITAVGSYNGQGMCKPCAKPAVCYLLTEGIDLSLFVNV